MSSTTNQERKQSVSFKTGKEKVQSQEKRGKKNEER
jgi:hypothetical protein